MATQAVEAFGAVPTPVRGADGFSEKRSEPRHEDLVERAVLTFRGADYPVRVVNISSRGTMIEADLVPRLGESVVIRFEACSPIHAFARWSRDGRIGLNFGCEMILG